MILCPWQVFCGRADLVFRGNNVSFDTPLEESVFVLNGMLHVHEHDLWHAPCFWHALLFAFIHFDLSWHAPGLSASLSENCRFRQFSESTSEAGDPRQSLRRILVMCAFFIMAFLMRLQNAMPRARMWSAHETDLGPDSGLHDGTDPRNRLDS